MPNRVSTAKLEQVYIFLLVVCYFPAVNSNIAYHEHCATADSFPCIPSLFLSQSTLSTVLYHIVELLCLSILPFEYPWVIQ